VHAYYYGCGIREDDFALSFWFHLKGAEESIILVAFTLKCTKCFLANVKQEKNVILTSKSLFKYFNSKHYHAHACLQLKSVPSRYTDCMTLTPAVPGMGGGILKGLSLEKIPRGYANSFVSDRCGEYL
jgi:hypothetical protein